MPLRRSRVLTLTSVLALLLVASLIQVAPARAATFVADFTADAVGAPPAGWTSRWAPGYFAVQDDPLRLVQGPSSSPERLLSFDAAGTPSSPEVRAVVHVGADNAASTSFQIHLAGAGASGEETSYFIEEFRDDLRLRVNIDGSATTLDSVEIPGEFQDNVWYEVAFAEDDGELTASIWPFGTPEPTIPMVSFTDPTPLSSGWAGIGSGNAGTNPAYADFAWFSVGTGNDPAPTPPVDLVAQAVSPTLPVTGVTITPDWGFVTVGWDPSPENDQLLTQYEVERVPVDDGDAPLGEPLLVGVWRFNRYTYTGESTTFADAGFIPGGRYGWRVRAVADGVEGPWSDWTYADTMAAPSPSEAYRTEFEEDPDDWTSYEGEVAFTNAIVNSGSDRVRVELTGRTHLGRDINLFVFGNPPPTPEEARAGSTVFLNCNVHGPEAGGREACFMMIRYLTFSEDQFVTDLLDALTVIIMPSMNGDGRAAGSRGNAHGNQDLNRDHSLLREPETLAVARAISAYEPTIAIDGHHYGNNDVGDLPLLWARNEAVDAEVAGYTQDALTLGHIFNAAEGAGWWPQPYPIGYSEETILRNTLGLKGVVGILLESRSSGGPTRPNASGSGGPTQQNHNDRRHAYSHLWTYRELLRFSLDNYEEAEAIQQASWARNSLNEGPLILHGTRDTPRINPPIRESREGTVVETPPCGYLITTEQYTERPVYDGNPEFGLMPSAQTRLDAHGISVQEVEDGIFIPLGQPLRGLIALLFDPAAPGQQPDYSSYGSYQGPFLYSGEATPVATCPAAPGGGGGGGGGLDPAEEPTEEPTDEPTDEPTPEPTPDPEPFVERLEGEGRLQTAIAVSQADFADGEASNIVLARADEYADALAGAPLAVALHAPVLINPSDTLDDAVAEEIARALAPGGTVYLLGGEAALAASVEQALADAGYQVVRLAGSSRVETALAIAEVIGDPAELLITTAFDYPDAMAAGAAAGARGGAVLLTPAGTPHPAVDAYLADSDADAYAVGGPAAAAYPDATPVVGPTRTATAVAVAETFFDAPMALGLTRDDDFPDALAGGARLGRLQAPLLLTASTTLSPETASYVSSTPSLTSAVLLGGEQAISTSVLDALTGLLNPVR